MTILSTPQDSRNPADAAPLPENVRVRTAPPAAGIPNQDLGPGGPGRVSNVRVGEGGGAPHAVRLPQEAPSGGEPSPEPERPARPRCRIAITGTRIFVTLFVMAVAVPLAYLGGILAGERTLPKEPTPVELAAAAKGGEEEAAAKEEPAEEDAGEKILQPHELTFSRSLKAGPGEGVPEKPKARKPFRPAVAPEGEDASLPPMAPGMSPARPSGPPEPPAVPSELYDFVFQVATYRSEKSADEMRAELEGEGHRTSIERAGSSVLVFVRLRGTLEQGEALRAKMAARYGEPIERMRKPVIRPLDR